MVQKRRLYKKEFKILMFELYKNGKRKTDIVHDFNIPLATLNYWIKKFERIDSSATVLLTHSEFFKLHEEIFKLRKENFLLKKAANDMGKNL